MKAKMKLLDYTLITLLSGFAAYAAADPAQGSNAVTPRMLANSPQMLPSSSATSSLVKTTNAVAAGKNIIMLPNKGMIWASEDPTLISPELSVSAPTYVAFDQGKIQEQLSFYVRSNYSAFIKRYEISIYRDSDTDYVEPLAVLPVEVGAITNIKWDGVLPEQFIFRVGDQLRYVLRAYDDNDHFDETYSNTIEFVTPEQARNSSTSLRDSVATSTGTLMSTDESMAYTLLTEAATTNDIKQQNIPIAGALVKIQGSNIPEGGTVSIDNESYPIDLNRRFLAEFLSPVGKRRFDVEYEGKDGEYIAKPLTVDISGDSFFMVGIADLTLYHNSASGPGKMNATIDTKDSDILSTARLAFYSKSKWSGRFTVTAHADTEDQEIEDLFSGFGKSKADDVFRSLDPNDYYPTYGDDSSVYRDVDTQGKFYIRVDWDKSQALWGNYNTGITGTEYGQFSRSLYGAALNYRSVDTTVYGDASTEFKAFVSQANSVAAHNEFLGTGGSLYYLKNTQIVSGSDKVYLKITDRTTGLDVAMVSLVRGVDYEISAVQGRLMLTTPLAQLTRQNVPSITTDSGLNGYEQRLVVDYEYVPSSYDNDQVIAGGRAKQWLGDHVAGGVTYVDDKTTGEDYTLKGGDITLKAGNGTYLKAEFLKSESSGIESFYSDNGGFSFNRKGSVSESDEGYARAVDAKVNFKELGWLKSDVAMAAWWHRIDAGFTSSSFSSGRDTTKYGGEFSGRFYDNLTTYTRYSTVEQGNSSYQQVQLTTEYRMENSALTGEIRRVALKGSSSNSTSNNAAGVLAAVKYSHRITNELELYGIGQVTLDDDHGNYKDNNAVTVGADYIYGDSSSIGAETMVGQRGNATQVYVSHRFTPDYSVYTNYSWSTSSYSSDYESVFESDRTRGWTVGQRWRLNDRLSMFNESQALKENRDSSSYDTLGLDYLIAEGWTATFQLQDGKVITESGGRVDRTTASAGLTRTNKDMEWSSKLEWRHDRGAEQRVQWVSTNRISIKLDESWRVAGKLNFADTDDNLNSNDDARYVEGQLGFAYRPIENNKWGMFGRYTYLYDLATTGQDSGENYDQRSNILSLEGVYKLDANWEFGMKLAHREGEVRYGRGQGAWYSSSTNFMAGQVRYDIWEKWHVLGEYRWLGVKDGGNKSGFLLGIDRDITENLRIGVGYNFTDFSDDLTKYDYKYRGFFLNMVGYM